MGKTQIQKNTSLDKHLDLDWLATLLSPPYNDVSLRVVNTEMKSIRRSQFVLQNSQIINCYGQNSSALNVLSLFAFRHTG